METDLTKAIKRELIKATPPIGVFGCCEVTIGWYGKERVDYLTYDTKGIWRCYEIKISKSDFYSDNHNTFVGHYNYYVIPEYLLLEVEKDIPEHIGGLPLLRQRKGTLNLCKRARKQTVENSEVLKDSLIRSLYRDVRNLQDCTDENIIRNYKRQLTKKDELIHSLNREIGELRREIRELKRHNHS